jgi:hypothetical protein
VWGENVGRKHCEFAFRHAQNKQKKMRAAARRARGLAGTLRRVDARTGTLACTRGWAADAAPLPSSSCDEADPAAMRRLGEMEAAGFWRKPSSPAPAWPSPADAARFLSGGAASSSSSSTAEAPVALPTLPWREAVRMARAAGLGAAPLTDGFGCVWLGGRALACIFWNDGR